MPAPPASNVITLSGVSKTYGFVRALTNVSLQLAPGITVVRGANGSGKSTILSILGTLTRPTAGDVDFGALGPTREDVRAQLGWVGHELLVYADLSARENLTLCAALHGLDAEVVAKVAARFGMESFLDRPVRTMSRGQRQRVAVARAVLNEPRLLLLDEPTTGLDSDGVALLERVVGEEASRGGWVVVVTHEVEFLRHASSVWMARGRLSSAPGVSRETSPAATGGAEGA
ncbi:MAG: heme ABC exporter ATP-binding protein CcmA [Myxococcales bacterium]|nr:heme ABC exporter ATP-binding protein CcmA [Myxococcales bacterium]